MACQLRAENKGVPLLVIIDAILPDAIKHSIHKRLLYEFGELRQRGIRGLAKRAHEYVRCRMDRGVAPPLGLQGLDEDDVRRNIYNTAARAYVREEHLYDGPAVIIRASDNKALAQYDVDADLGWQRHIRGDLRVFQAPGDHLGVLREDVTGDIIRRELGRVHRELGTGPVENVE